MAQAASGFPGTGLRAGADGAASPGRGALVILVGSLMNS